MDDAEDLLATPEQPGELRRLTIFFADVVDSTSLSTSVEPETYRLLVGRYRELVLRAVDRYEGHISSTKGDGLLAVFGHPLAHEDDVRRAVQAGLDLTRDVKRLSDQAERRFGIGIGVRVGVHRGLVYLDTAQDDVYGFGANLTARVSGLAQPNSVVVSDAVAPLVRKSFVLEQYPPASVKGVVEPITSHHVVGERSESTLVGEGPLVGRDVEFGRLQATWARMRSDSSATATMVFCGEAGLGKSRLAAAAAGLAAADGATVVELSGSPLHSSTGLHPVRALLERRCGMNRHAPHGERLRLLAAELVLLQLDELVPVLAPVLGVDPSAGYQPVAAEGRRLYDTIAAAVQRYLLACLGGNAALLVVEDLHWFDPSTLDVVDGLIGRTGSSLTVMTGRPGSWLPSADRCEVFDLKPLDDAQADALVDALSPGLSGEQRAAVVSRCDGIPFFLEQVVNGRNEIGVPEALYEPLFARLRASRSVVPVVEAAAILGRYVDRDVLCAVADVDEAELDQAIGELRDARVLEPCGARAWRFRHELLRELAAELAPPSVRSGVHRRIADVLTREGEPDWRLIAGHHQGADCYLDAASAYERASVDAKRRGSLAEARDCLSHALEQLARTARSSERDRYEALLRRDRGLLTAAADGYQSPQAAADFERCLDIGEHGLAADERRATLTAVANYYLIRGDLRQVCAVIETQRDGRGGRLPTADALSGAVACLRGELDTARSALSLVLPGADDPELASEKHFTELSTAPRLYLAVAALLGGDPAGAARELGLAASLAETFDFPWADYRRAYIRSLTTWMHLETGRLDEADRIATDLIADVERCGLDMWPVVGATWRAAVGAMVALDEGADQEEVLDHATTLRLALDSARALGVNMYTTIFDAIVGRLLLAAGRATSARERFDRALALALDTGMHFYDAELLRLRAHTEFDPARRRTELERAVTLAHTHGAALLEARAARDLER